VQAILDDAVIQALLPSSLPRVLVFRALAARNVVPDRLRENGCMVETIAAYATFPASMARRAELISMLEAQTLDCILLTSSSTADRLADLLGTQATALLRPVFVASIGPITTETAEAHGFSVGLTAMDCTVAGLLVELESHFADHPELSTRLMARRSSAAVPGRNPQ